MSKIKCLTKEMRTQMFDELLIGYYQQFGFDEDKPDCKGFFSSTIFRLKEIEKNK